MTLFKHTDKYSIDDNQKLVVKKKYLLEVFIENKLKLLKHKLNLIKAPCGSGKTHFFFEYLCRKYSKRRILYLADTIMLKDDMVASYVELELYGDKDKRFTDTVKAMSFKYFGQKLMENNDFLKNFDLVVIDEAHNVVNFANIGRRAVKQLVDENISDANVNDATAKIQHVPYLASNLPRFIEEYETLFLMMTATPDKIYSEYKDIVYDVLQGIELEGYLNKLTLDYKDNYLNAINLLQKNIQDGDKVLIYTKRVSTCREIKSHLIALGYNAEYLCSPKTPNTENKMGVEQLELRDYLIKNNRLPDDLDVLIINAAYETGWNLFDERVQIVISNTTDKDATVQARGRCRHDIRLLIQKNNTSYDNTFIGILESNRDVKLFTKEDKLEIRQQLGEHSRQGGTLIGWSAFKKKVEATGIYTVKTISGRLDGKPRKYDMIIKKD